MLDLARSLSVFAWVAVVAGATCGCTAPRVAQSSDLPISRAVLYENGVGYFERRGVVHGDALVLHAQPNQIGDLLKSLTIVSLSGGQAVSAAMPVDPSNSKRPEHGSSFTERVRRTRQPMQLRHGF